MRRHTFATLATGLVLAIGPASSLARAQKQATETAATTVTTVRRDAALSAVPTNPKLVARLQAMLPRGTTVQDAAVGFTNQNEFVAAVQLSKNLDIPFGDLRQLIVNEGMSVGQAIRHERPDVDVGHELRRARRMALAEL